MSHSKKIRARYDHKCILVLMCCNRCCCHILMTFEVSRHIVEISQMSNSMTMWEPNCSLRTDRHDEANSYFSQFCERAQNEYSVHLCVTR
jgi:hypothetical protein